MAEWNLNQVASATSPTTQSIGNEWNVGQPAAASSPTSTVQQPSQQWEVAAQQWNVGQPASVAQARAAEQTAQSTEGDPQWNMSVSTPQSQNGQWNVVEQQKTEPAVVQSTAPELPSTPSAQQGEAETKSSSDVSVSPQKKDEVSTQQDDSSKVVDTAAPSASTEEATKQIDSVPSVASPVSAIPQAETERTVVTSDNSQPAEVPVAASQVTNKTAIPQPVACPQEIVKPAESLQQPAPSLAAAKTTSIQASTATPIVNPPVPPQATTAQSSVQQPTAVATQEAATTVDPQHVPGVSIGTQKAAPQTAPKATAQVTMQPKISHQGVTQAPYAQQVTLKPHITPTPQQAAVAHGGPAPTVKPKPHGNNHDVLKREGGEEFPLEEKQKGVFWLGPDLEGWVDKTKALKEEFRRQSDANEMYFVKNQQPLNLKSLNTSEDPSKFIYTVLDHKGVDVVNLIRCILNENHHSETGPFFFQFGDEKKFKLELLPTATQPGNGLVKSVGRRKYYAYPDICSMLKTAGVTSKGLGIMLQKLNTSGLKPALHNQISPMNELHFMLLYEIARRLVRGPHGFSLSTEPEFDHLPIGVAVARMITMFCKGNYCLNYEAVFGVQDKFNPFIDTSVVLRRQKIYALNKLFYDAEIRSQASDNPYISKFLKYHNGYIIKTTKGFMDELDMAFRGF